MSKNMVWVFEVQFNLVFMTQFSAARLLLTNQYHHQENEKIIEQISLENIA